MTLEEKVHQEIDEQLAIADWIGQGLDKLNPGTFLGVAVRE